MLFIQLICNTSLSFFRQKHVSKSIQIHTFLLWFYYITYTVICQLSICTNLNQVFVLFLVILSSVQFITLFSFSSCFVLLSVDSYYYSRYCTRCQYFSIRFYFLHNKNDVLVFCVVQNALKKEEKYTRCRSSGISDIEFYTDCILSLYSNKYYNINTYLKGKECVVHFV